MDSCDKIYIRSYYIFIHNLILNVLNIIWIYLHKLTSLYKIFYIHHSFERDGRRSSSQITFVPSVSLI